MQSEYAPLPVAAVETGPTKRIRVSLSILVAWTLLRIIGPYSLLSSAFRSFGLNPQWFELPLLTILVSNIVHSFLNFQQAPLNLPVPSSEAPSQTLALSTPTHRRLQGIVPRRARQSLSPSSSYASTPISNPSRLSSYRAPSSVSASPLNQSYTPSPLAAYRGRHSNGPGRPLDTSLLNRLMAEADDD